MPTFFMAQCVCVRVFREVPALQWPACHGDLHRWDIIYKSMYVCMCVSIISIVIGNVAWNFIAFFWLSFPEIASWFFFPLWGLKLKRLGKQLICWQTGIGGLKPYTYSEQKHLIKKRQQLELCPVVERIDALLLLHALLPRRARYQFPSHAPLIYLIVVVFNDSPTRLTVPVVLGKRGRCIIYNCVFIVSYKLIIQLNLMIIK